MFSLILILLVFCLSIVNLYINIFSLVMTNQLDNFKHFKLRDIKKIKKAINNDKK